MLRVHTEQILLHAVDAWLPTPGTVGPPDGPCPQDVPSSVSLGGWGTHCRVQGWLELVVARPAEGEATMGPALRPAPLATPHTAQQHHHRADRAPAHSQA